MDFYQIIVAIIGAFLAGVVNTLAGNGSAITLSILTEIIGLPANVANGTNRVGIMFQTLAGVFAFRQNKKLDLNRSKVIITSTFIGGILGAYVATLVTNEQFTFVFKILMVSTLIVILVNPKRWLSSSNKSFTLSPWITIPVFIAVGFYGGFIQMGMGIFFLAVMVLLAKYDLIEANAVKVFVVALYTILILVLFHWKGLIDWKVGAIFAIGQTAGGYLTANYASKYESASVWAYRVLVVVVILAVAKMFGLFELF